MKLNNLKNKPNDGDLVVLFDEEGDFVGTYLFYQHGIENVYKKIESMPKANSHSVYVPSFLFEGDCDLDTNSDLFVFDNMDYVWAKLKITQKDFFDAFYSVENKEVKPFIFGKKEIKTAISYSISTSLKETELVERLLDNIYGFGQKDFTREDLTEGELIGYFWLVLIENHLLESDFEGNLTEGLTADFIADQYELNDYIFNSLWEHI
jgi:hypothetical protein